MKSNDWNLDIRTVIIIRFIITKEKIMEEIILKEINKLLNKYGVSNHFDKVIYDRIKKNEYLRKMIRFEIEFAINEELKK